MRFAIQGRELASSRVLGEDVSDMVFGEPLGMFAPFEKIGKQLYVTLENWPPIDVRSSYATMEILGVGTVGIGCSAREPLTPWVKRDIDAKKCCDDHRCRWEK